MENEASNWQQHYTGDRLARTAIPPALRAMKRAGVHESEMEDVFNISFTAARRIAESSSKCGGGTGGFSGFGSLMYMVTLRKALRPLKSEMIQRSKCELLTAAGTTQTLDDATGAAQINDPIEAHDAKATALRLVRPASWRPPMPYAGIDARAFLDSLNASARALLVDLAVYGEDAEATAARLASVTGERWSVRRVKRIRARLRAAWKSFFGKFPTQGSEKASSCD